MEGDLDVLNRPILGDEQTRGSSGRDNRMFVEAVLWIVPTGSPWRDLPDGFGSWNNAFRVDTRFEKNARNYLAIVTFAVTILWLR